MADLDPESLASRADVVRDRTRRLDAGPFKRMQQRIEDGLTWGVGALVTDDRDRVLLVRERDEWLLPGGGVEEGETHGSALVREVAEETGIAISVGSVLAVTDQTFTHGEKSVSFHFAIYDATPESTAITDDPGVAAESIQAVEWLDTLPAATVDRALLDRLL